MGKRIARIIITVVFAALGVSIAKYALDSKLLGFIELPNVRWLPAASYAGAGLVFGVIGFFVAPALVRLYEHVVSSFVKRSSDVPLSKIFVGVIGLVIALVIAYLLSSLPLRIRPQIIGTILTVIMYFVFGAIGWLIPTRRMKEIVLPNWFRSTNSPSKTLAANKLLDTSAIIDGRFFDVYKTGIIEGTVYIPEFVLDELRHIADSPDPLKRARGRRGLDLLNDVRDSAAVNSIVVTSKDYPELEEVDAKLLRLASDMHACVVTNDYNLNKAASVSRIQVFNINDLAAALRTNVTAGEEIIVTITKEGKEATQGVGYFDDGTMIVVEGARAMLGETLAVIVTSVLQTSAGKMVFAKLKDDLSE